MLDPLPLRSPPWLQRLSAPLSAYLEMPTLTPHIHQVIFAFGLYQFTFVYLSPVLSTLLFPHSYPKLSRRTRINWDVHVVSFVQSLLVCGLAGYVMVYDMERKAMGWRERVYGYTGALGLTQAFGCGYFLWDLYVCTRYLSMFGPGMLAHAVSALAVYSFGFVSFCLSGFVFLTPMRKICAVVVDVNRN
jgi:TLC domain